jgi:cytochrome c-type biogenesis protein CcmH/NrfG
MENSSNLIELANNIQWLLVALVVIGVILLIVLSFGAWAMFIAGKKLIDQHKDKVFRVLAEEHLNKNENTELITHCNERLDTHPSDVWAHWYLGQAQFHTNLLHESLRSFERALEIEPSWYSSIDSWLEKITNKVKESGPKLVD